MKHIIDTSVLRPLLTSPRKVKDYYKASLTGDIYITDYVRMEFLRGYIKSCINFYNLLSMPQYDSLSDVIHIWSQKYQNREHKNIEIMIANLLDKDAFSKDKEKLKLHIADYIRRLIGKSFTQFKNIGNDSTYCSKGNLKLDFDPDDIDGCFQNYLSILSSNEAYDHCRIENFLKQKNNISIERLIASKDIILESDPKGFLRLIKSLEKIDVNIKITCHFCSQLGDCIIAFLWQKGWRLEHTDNSFDYLCKVLEIEHYKHPYDGIIMNET